MIKVIAVFLPYLAAHTYTDIKQRRTSNKVNLFALLVLLYLAYPNIVQLITVLLYCLATGLFLERLGVWMPGDTRMFAICGGYVSLLKVPAALYIGATMLVYTAIGAVLLARRKMLGRPNLLAVFQPALREEGVWFPGAVMITLSSLGVIVWKSWIL